MTPEELTAVRVRLEDFAAEVFAPLARRDQRINGGLYLRGLMLDGRRKSMQPMAARLGVDHQRLQRFVTSSTWDYVAVRRRLAVKAAQVVRPEAWALDDTGHLKDGDASPGVARQYTGTAGKVTDCQVAVSVPAVTGACSAPLDWRLFLPEHWDDTRAGDAAEAKQIAIRRRRAGIGDDQRYRPKWRQGLDMIDELTGWGLAPPVISADAGYGENNAFRVGLEDRGLGYVVAVKAATSAYAADAVPETVPYPGRGRPSVPRYRGEHATVRALALAAGRRSCRRVTWRHGTKTTPDNPAAAMRSRFLAIRVRPAHRTIPRLPDGSLPIRWLLAEWPPGEPEPTDSWLSNLPAHTPLRVLVRLAKIRWRIEHDYRELKTALGLTHFEGRSFIGWHRHVTLVGAAHLFCTQLRLAGPKAAGAA